MDSMTPIIRLEEDSHIYTVQTEERGPFTVKPSVTEILNEWILVDGWYVNIYSDPKNPTKIPRDVFEDAGDFGRAVHKAAKFVMQGKQITLPHEIAHAICELERWMSDYKIEPVHYEMLGYSKKLDVCGTLDLVCRMGYQVLNLPDYKTAAHAPTVGPQTWAYEQIYREMTGYRGIIKRWVLYLPKKDGEYKFIELRDNIGDEHMFRSMHYAFAWRRR